MISRRHIFGLLAGLVGSAPIAADAELVSRLPAKPHDLHAEGFPKWVPIGFPWRVQRKRFYAGKMYENQWGTTKGEPFQDGDCNGAWHIAVRWDSGETYSQFVGDLMWDNYHG